MGDIKREVPRLDPLGRGDPKWVELSYRKKKK